MTMFEKGETTYSIVQYRMVPSQLEQGLNEIKLRTSVRDAPCDVVG